MFVKIIPVFHHLIKYLYESLRSEDTWKRDHGIPSIFLFFDIEYRIVYKNAILIGNKIVDEF